jgi:hypothetical protein
MLLLLSKLSSFRASSATSLFLLSALHWQLIEDPSSGYLGLLTRSIPILIIPAWCLYWVFARELTAAKNNNAPIVRRRSSASPRAT